MRRPDDSSLRRRLAANVRRIRREADMTQQEVAAAAAFDLRQLAKIEAAQASVTLRTLVKLADALDVTPADLLAPPRR